VLGRPRASADYNYSERDKRTEELEEAGYRSPTWAVLRALQQINSATRIEGEAAMSTPPFFQSAGRGDLLFWGEKEIPTVVIWESLSEQEKGRRLIAGRAYDTGHGGSKATSKWQ